MHAGHTTHTGNLNATTARTPQTTRITNQTTNHPSHPLLKLTIHIYTRRIKKQPTLNKTRYTTTFSRNPGTIIERDINKNKNDFTS